MEIRKQDPESISSHLDWKQFEELSEKAFAQFGFETFKNFRMTKPRMEVDLLAIRKELAFSVDCKHWKRTVGRGAMLRIGDRQITRSMRLLGFQGVSKVIPVVLTWHDELIGVLENGVPIVPIHRLTDFVMNWESADQILVLSS
ncbi:MAG: restriction endonuclease [Nitrososphaerota archaeon]|nr:restriction endonuclease [Nitrososphaerota archaeon]